jgi:phenylalanine-4-hydroxylase
VKVAYRPLCAAQLVHLEGAFPHPEESEGPMRGVEHGNPEHGNLGHGDWKAANPQAADSQHWEPAGLVDAKRFLIEQDYAKYTADQQALWSELVERRMAQLKQCACREYLEGWDALGLGAERIPCYPEISQRLYQRTGWRAQPVSAFMPERAFFEMLKARMFPVTVWLRSRESMDYIPEPDMLHDALGHLPMFADQSFADAVEEYGRVCHAMENEEKLERMGRLYWYTFEFGLIRQAGEVRVYGSGVASSQKECTNVYSGGCEICDFTVERVLNTTVKVDRIHSRLFAIRDFSELHTAVGEALRIVGHE